MSPYRLLTGSSVEGVKIKSGKKLGIMDSFLYYKLLPAPLTNFIKKSLYNNQSALPITILHLTLIL